MGPKQNNRPLPADRQGRETRNPEGESGKIIINNFNHS